MTIEQTKLERITQDFYTGPDQSVLNLEEKEKKKFWNWFNKKAIKLNVSNSPEKRLIDSNENIGGRCYGNSQTIALNEDFDYYEGFIKQNGCFNLHGFNVKENEVHDYTALSHTEAYKEPNNKMPTEYYGIKIDKAFIEKHNKEAISKKETNIDSLLKKLYIEENPE